MVMTMMAVVMTMRMMTMMVMVMAMMYLVLLVLDHYKQLVSLIQDWYFVVVLWFLFCFFVYTDRKSVV